MAKVSVIIPCYNLGQYLDEAVDSVLHQTFCDLEILIVDDGSTDDFTRTLLGRYHKPLTRVLRMNHQGVAAARNYGIRASCGTYICCLDADDAYHPDFLAETVAALDADAAHEVGFVTTGLRAMSGEPLSWSTSGFDPIGICISNCVHVASLFRRESWEKAGGYREDLTGFHDWCFWISLVAAGYRWLCIDKPLFLYRIRPDSMLRTSYLHRNIIYRDIVRHNLDFFTAHAEAIIARLHDTWDIERESRLDLEARLQACQQAISDLTKNRDSLRKAVEDLTLRMQSEEQAHARTRLALQSQSATLDDIAKQLNNALAALADASSANAALNSKLAEIRSTYLWRLVVFCCRILLRLFPDNRILRRYVEF